MTIKSLRIALFIDAENTNPKQIGQAIAYCSKVGRISVRRVYGNAASLVKWSKVAADHCLVPMQTPPSAAKQNASDFALTLDAASLLHRGLFDHAVIMSSDADFTQLVMHIRENGLPVSGLGEAKTPKLLQAAFDEFITLEPGDAKPSAKKAPVVPAAPKARATKSPASDVDGISRSDLLKLFAELESGQRKVHVTTMATRLKALHPAYKRGFRTAENFLKKSGLFDVASGLVSRTTS